MDKFEIIKAYILQNSDNFSLAMDIVSHFPNIKLDMLNVVYEKLKQRIKEQSPLATKIEPLGLYAYNQYINVHYRPKLLVQIKFNNYFSFPILSIYDGGPSFIDAATYMKKNYDDSLGNDLSLTDYVFNSINKDMDLFRLFNEQDLQNELVRNFDNHVIPRINSVLEAFFSKQPKEVSDQQ